MPHPFGWSQAHHLPTSPFCRNKVLWGAKDQAYDLPSFWRGPPILFHVLPLSMKLSQKHWGFIVKTVLEQSLLKRDVFLMVYLCFDKRLGQDPKACSNKNGSLQDYCLFFLLLLYFWDRNASEGPTMGIQKKQYLVTIWTAQSKIKTKQKGPTKPIKETNKTKLTLT